MGKSRLMHFRWSDANVVWSNFVTDISSRKQIPKRSAEYEQRIRCEDYCEPLAPEATHHRPGTLGKIEVMAQRVAQGQSCFHPGDPAIWLPASATMAARIAQAMDDEDRE